MAELASQGSGAAPKRRLGAVIAAVIAAAFVALLIFGLRAKAPDRTVQDALSRGRSVPAPVFALAALSAARGSTPGELAFDRAARDGRVELPELRGRPVVLNLWASWCAPCRDEAPVLEHAWRAARASGALFVGLNMQDARPSARRFLAEYGLTFPHVRDPTDETARRYGATGIPETYFIASNGRIVDHVIGVVSGTQLAEGLKAARTGLPRTTREGGEQRPTR